MITPKMAALDARTNLTREEVIANWQKSRNGNIVILSMNHLLGTDPEWPSYKYLIRFDHNDIEGVRGLLASEMTYKLYNRCFPVVSDSHFVLARLLLTGMTAWHFRSGKRIIRP